jgi:hypothetical protein
MYNQPLVLPQIYHTGATPEGVSTVATAKSLLLGVMVENVTGSTIYVQVFDRTTAPTSLEVPICEVQVSATSQESLDFGSISAVPCTSGIVLAGSSTSGKYTAVASSMWLTAFYVAQ